jgi:hypothetical protein
MMKKFVDLFVVVSFIKTTPVLALFGPRGLMKKRINRRIGHQHQIMV